jgi:hypothetical protein
MLVLKKLVQARLWWLTSVILATQEAERSGGPQFVAAQANSSKDPISKKTITKESW